MLQNIFIKALIFMEISTGMKIFIITLLAGFICFESLAIDITVANNSTDHSLATDVQSIQYAINTAAIGDRVILNANSAYIIKNKLILKNGVQLVGSKGDAAFTQQSIMAFASFPVNVEMIQLQGGTTTHPSVLQNLVFDGANAACVILKTVENKSNYLLKKCVFKNTRNSFTANPVGATYWDVSILIFQKANLVTIDSCDMRNAGLGEITGKINPYNWNGFGAGIKFYNGNNITVKNSTINRTLTEGIRLSGATQVLIENNTISRPGMNNEWADGTPNQGLILASGITGYHNQKAKNNNCETAQNWQILNNRFFWCYNNAMSLSGKGFTVSGNRVNYVIQHALFLGDWRNCSALEKNGRERVTQCNVLNNDFENSYYNLTQWSWVFNRGTQSYQRPEPEFRKALRINGIVNNDSTVIISNNNLHGQQPFYEFGFYDMGTTCQCALRLASQNINIVTKKSITVFPNPAHTFIKVENTTSKSIEIFHKNGSLILQTTKATIDIAQLEKGLYFVRCGNEIAWFIKE